MIVDNSADPLPTRQVVEQAWRQYTRVPGKGLSRGGNAALQLAGTRWSRSPMMTAARNQLAARARPPAPGTRTARPSTGSCPRDHGERAEITFEVYGGLGRGLSGKTWTLGRHPSRYRRSKPGGWAPARTC